MPSPCSSRAYGHQALFPLHESAVDVALVLQYAPGHSVTPLQWWAPGGSRGLQVWLASETGQFFTTRHFSNKWQGSEHQHLANDSSNSLIYLLPRSISPTRFDTQGQSVRGLPYIHTLERWWCSAMVQIGCGLCRSSDIGDDHYANTSSRLVAPNSVLDFRLHYYLSM